MPLQILLYSRRYALRPTLFCNIPKLVYAVWQARALRDQFADEARKAAKREKLELKEAQRKREEKQRAEEKVEEEETKRVLEKVQWMVV